MKRLLFGLALALLPAAAAQAEPLNPQQISADAKWVAHVDFDSARDSQLGQRFQTLAVQNERVKNAVERLQNQLGLDPLNDLHSATLYGVTFEPDQGVLVVHADADNEKLITHLKTKPDYKTSEEGDVLLHSWTDRRGNRQVPVVAAFTAGSAVFASSEEQVLGAIGVLKGEGSSLGSDSALARVVDGAFFQATAIGMSEAKLAVRSPILARGQQVSVALGEKDGDVFFQGRLKAGSEEDANRVAGVVQGIRAAGELRYEDDADSLAVVRGIKADTAGSVVEVGWRAPADEVIAMIRRERERAAENRDSE